MEGILKLERQAFRSKRLAALVIALTLAVLGCAIISAQLYFREKLRGQIVQRDGEILHAVSVMQQSADEASGEFTGPADVPEAYFDEMLKISRLKGVVAVRLFDSKGTFINAFPSYITEGTISADDLASLQHLTPASHFYPHASIKELDILASNDKAGKTTPLLEVNIPLATTNGLVGAGQFIIEGTGIATAYGELDRNLIIQGAAVFAGAGSLLAAILLIAYQRLQRMNRLLYEANKELALAAKTSAIGAVTSHLIHGLKNPLHALQLFIHQRQSSGTETDWKHAIASTQRMQSLINEVVGILQDQRLDANYEVSFTELRDLISAKLHPVARTAGVALQIEVKGDAILPSRHANLTGLILENLVQNALQATPKGKSVRLDICDLPTEFAFTVADEGPGFPPHLMKSLFKPCASTKPGGGGIGLAICGQLAAQIGAKLELKNSSAAGCVFLLSLPKAGGAAIRVVSPEAISV